MSRDYVFTSWTQPKPEFDKLKYVCWGVEQCPTTNREHYQGFIVFNRTHRIPSAKRILGGGDTAHLESRRGSREQAREYCRKGNGQFIEYGEYQKYTVTELLRMPIEYIMEYEPLMYVRYHRGIEKLHAHLKGDKWRDVKVYVLWGKTGTNKTRTVMEKDNVYKIDPPYSWWDGYGGEEILLIDDYKIGMIPRGMLLNLLDGYRLRLETKGGHLWALWKEVYITTNYDPEMWDDAVLRRVTSVSAMG